MAYPYQGRTIIDETKRLSMSILIQLGYVKPGVKASGVLQWSENFKLNAMVGIKKGDDFGYLRLNYVCNGGEVESYFDLVSRKSNLPNSALIWYFVCPSTEKLCRKIYFNGRVFVHQSAIDGLYQSQTLSRKARQMDKLFGFLLGPNDIYQQLTKKHLKRYYKGEPTKKINYLLKWKRRIDQITPGDIERLVITGSL
jgi:hypothetical protein